MENIIELTEIFNDLIQINNDRIDSCEKALENPKFIAGYSTSIKNMIQQSTNNRQDLTGYIRKTWDDPGWRSSTIAGKIYRHYINLNAGFKGRSDTLKLFELGEEAAMIAYEQAMDSLIQLPEGANLMMHFQYAGFKESHEIIKLWIATKKDKIKHSGTIETLGKLKFFLN